MIMEDLSPYDRATVGLWARSHRQMMRQAGAWVEVAAAHALLARLRSCVDQRQLFARYEAETTADFALIGSLLPGEPAEETPWRIRDAAFHLRWAELSRSR
jgi:hypothetical protein